MIPGDGSEQAQDLRIEGVSSPGHPIGEERIEQILGGGLRVEHRALARVHLSEGGEKRDVRRSVHVGTFLGGEA
jgi:hypothetical protein